MKHINEIPHIAPTTMTSINDFTPCPIMDEDEYYGSIFSINVTALIAYINKQQEAFYTFDMDINNGIYKPPDMSEFKFHDTPGLYVELSPNNYALVDGRHRQWYRRERGESHFRCIVVRYPAFIPFLTTMKGYGVFVPYWNSKVEEYHHNQARKATL